jgi:potassium efflux system protein
MSRQSNTGLLTFQESVMKLILRRAILLLIAGAISLPAVAQQTPAAPAPTTSRPQPPSEDIATQRAQVAAELKTAQAALDAATKDGQPAPENLTREVELLGRLDLTLGQALAAVESETELKQSKAQLTADLDNLRTKGPSEPRPYRFLLLDGLRDQLETEDSRDQSLADAAQAAQAALESAKATYEEKERARRQAKDALETNRDESRAPSLRDVLHLAELESRAAAGEVRLCEQELANQKLEVETHELRLAFLREKIDRVARDVRFDKQEIDDILAQLDQQEYRVNQALDSAKDELGARDAQWMDARRKLDASPTRDPVLVEEVEAQRLARQARQREIALLGQQLEALADSRKAWDRRFQVFNRRAETQALAGWEAETRRAAEGLERDVRLHTARLAELRKELVALDSKITAGGNAPKGVARWLQEQGQQLAALIRVHENTIDRLEGALRVHQRLLAEIGAKIKTVTWRERLGALWRGMGDVWNYEIASVKDSPITVRKIVIGIILLIVGVYASRFITGVLGRRLLLRVGLNAGAAAAIQSLVFYLLLFTVVMLALRIVNVPLTAFAIVGGALAIGIGFGSQNIVSNFISGLILLAERPIRVGDLIEIEELIGTVERIGPRSTRVRSPENVDIIVPNSSFLEKNVVNWTLTDDRYRAHVVVGVVYGSPTRDVTKLIRKALDDHGRILSKPEPIILFADFGDSALIFEAHFWVRMRRIMDRRVIESDIRYRIDALFREAGIVIAFPQRDVHLDSREPIPVRLLQNGEPPDTQQAHPPPPHDK